MNIGKYCEKLFDSWKKRLLVLLDKSALMLMLPAFAILYWIDSASAATLAQWSLFALVIAGVAVMISRIIFPHLDLNAYLKKALNGSVASGIVAAAVITFVGIAMVAIVLWAKP